MKLMLVERLRKSAANTVLAVLTYCNWKAQYGGMEASDDKRLMFI